MILDLGYLEMCCFQAILGLVFCRKIRLLRKNLLLSNILSNMDVFLFVVCLLTAYRAPDRRSKDVPAKPTEQRIPFPTVFVPFTTIQESVHGTMKNFTEGSVEVQV